LRIKRDVEIAYLRAVATGGNEATLRADRDARLAELDDDFAFLAECNIGSEAMAPEDVERLRRIAAVTWLRTLDDRLGLSWEERARQPPDPEPLPVLEQLLADKQSHLLPHRRPWRPAIPIVSRSNRRLIRPISVRSITSRSGAAR
jgi:hypothetical protein